MLLASPLGFGVDIVLYSCITHFMAEANSKTDLAARLVRFTDAGLLRRIPTRWQLLQGEWEMTPYVMSTDATDESAYTRRGHPVLRQLTILREIGLDHLATGSALGVKLESLCTHLELTHHQGMPVFDLQLVQSHPGGLAHLRARLEEMTAGSTPLGRRRRRIATRILRDPDGYLGRFFGADGWLARAERLDYATPAGEGSAFPPEFFSLVGFLDYCAATFPAERHLSWVRVPGHLLYLAGRRFREGRGFGWFGRRGRRGS
jgi:hypothetical protein